jgi:hypothetical protein
MVLKGLVFVCQGKSRVSKTAGKIKGSGGAKQGAEGAYPGAESDTGEKVNNLESKIQND